MPEDNKILIVADPYMNMIRQPGNFLARGGFHVYSIKTNAEAMTLQRKVKADLIVTGLDLPGMSGEAFCEHIRNDEELRNVSILIVSHKRLGEDKRCQNCRANAFLSVDASPEAFASTARKLLNVSERAGIRVAVSVRVDGKDKRGRPFLSYSENISATGMLVESERELATGEVVTCSFYLDDNTQIITNAEVVRSSLKSLSSHTNQYGLMFSGLSGGVLEAIETYVKQYNEPEGQ
jgi:CheY-like chemotaxis protein